MLLHYSQTAQHFNFVRHSRSTVVEEKLRVFSTNQNRANPDGPKSDLLNSTKETQGFPESRPSLRFYFFFRKTVIQGMSPYEFDFLIHSLILVRC